MHAQYLKEIDGWLEDFLWPEPGAKQRAKRQRLLESATGLFVRFGYRKTSMDEVARAAGVAKGTVYLYYQNKAELVMHAIALEKSVYLDRIEPLLAADLPAAQRLQAFIALGLISMREMPLLSRLTGGDQEIALALREVDDSVLERINAWRAEFMISLLDELTDHSWARNELLYRAQLLIDLIMAITVTGQLATHGRDLEQYAWTLAGTLIHGIAAPDAADAPRFFWSPADAGSEMTDEATSKELLV